MLTSNLIAPILTPPILTQTLNRVTLRQRPNLVYVHRHMPHYDRLSNRTEILKLLISSKVNIVGKSRTFLLAYLKKKLITFLQSGDSCCFKIIKDCEETNQKYDLLLENSFFYHAEESHYSHFAYYLFLYFTISGDNELVYRHIKS